MPLRVATLPGLRIFSPTGEVTSLASRRLPRALFVYLAVERAAARDSLLDVFWPERDSERARHSLSQTLYELRRALGEECVRVSGDVLSVPPDLETDLADFEAAVQGGRWTEALAQYGGGFLEGVTLGGSRGFEGWVDGRRAQVARLHRRARREVLRQQLEGGDLTGALAVAERWAELEPLEDEAQHRAIELLARLGRRSEALAHYELFRDRLRRAELEPMPELTELVAGIAAGTAALLPPGPVAPRLGALPAAGAAAGPGRQSAPAAPPGVVPGVSGAEPTGARGSSAEAPGAPPPAAPLAEERTPAPRPVARAVDRRRWRELAIGAGLGVVLAAAAVVLALAVWGVVARARVPLAIPMGMAGLALLVAAADVSAGLLWYRWKGGGQPGRRGREPFLVGPLGVGAGLGSALALAAAAGVVGFAARGGHTPAFAVEPPLAWSERPEPALGGPRKVALNRFQNRTGDPALAPIGRMADDWLAEALGAVPEVDVVADTRQTSADSGAGAIGRLARRTGAEIVVFGTYYRDGSDVLLGARLLPVPGGRMPLAIGLEEIGPVRAPLQHPAAGVARLAAVVAGALAAECLFPECVPGRSPPTYEAWRAWVDAHAALRDRHDLAATEQGFRRAIALDSTFVPAYVDLARQYLADGRCPKVDSLDDILEARADGVSDYDLLGMRALRASCRNDREAAYEDRAQAWQLAPQLAGARFELAAAAAAAGRLAEAEQHLQVLSTTWYSTVPGYWFVLMQVLHAQGRYDAELQAAEAARARAPCGCRFLYGLRALAALGRTAEIQARFAEARQGDMQELPIAELYRWIALELEWHGRTADARRFAEQALRELDDYPDEDRQTTEYRVRRASTLLQLGRFGEARAVLAGLRVAEDAPRIVPLELTITQATVLALQGIAAAKAGDVAAARAALFTVERLPDRAVSAPGVATREVCEAAILAALGDRDGARRRLAFAEEVGTVPRTGLEPYAHAEVILRDLWHDPQFDAPLAAPR